MNLTPTSWLDLPKKNSNNGRFIIGPKLLLITNLEHKVEYSMKRITNKEKIKRNNENKEEILNRFTHERSENDRMI